MDAMRDSLFPGARFPNDEDGAGMACHALDHIHKEAHTLTGHNEGGLIRRVMESTGHSHSVSQVKLSQLVSTGASRGLPIQRRYCVLYVSNRKIAT